MKSYSSTINGEWTSLINTTIIVFRNDLNRYDVYSDWNSQQKKMQNILLNLQKKQEKVTLSLSLSYVIEKNFDVLKIN